VTPEEEAALREENEQLRFALGSRTDIEQAKGVLIERLDLPPERAFDLLRAAARSSQTNLHDLAVQVLSSRVTPACIEQELGKLLKS